MNWGRIRWLSAGKAMRIERKYFENTEKINSPLLLIFRFFYLYIMFKNQPKTGKR